MRAALLRRTFLLLILSGILAAILAAVSRPLPPPLDAAALRISPAQASGLAHPLVIDARPAEEFAKGHVKGALNLTLATWDEDFSAVVGAWKPHQPLLVYCNPGSCHASEEVAQRLRTEAGMAEAYALDGDWKELRLP